MSSSSMSISSSRPSIFSSVLAKRVVTGLALIGMFATILYLGVVPLLILVIAVTASSTFEFLNVAFPAYRNPKIQSAADLRRNDAAFYTLLFALIPAAFAFRGIGLAAGVALVVCLLTLAREIRRFEFGEHEEPEKEILTAIGVAWFYPLFLGTALLGGVLAVSAAIGSYAWRVYAWYVLMIILNDTGAFFCGRLFGRTKLAPRVSPNKTIEGAAGALLIALAVSLPLGWALKLPYSSVVIFCIALITSILSQVGDLAESFLKRLYNVKDMGGILPGHGGVFDRVDGYLFAGAALYLFALCA